MVEFGEKVKQIREEQGMTQQTLAEKLYVTRQAVSRWERGARYPELLTAKKIARVLNVSLDELLSGEELKENIEKEPILTQPIENIVQTMLYTIAVIIYLLLCIYSAYSFLRPNKALIGTMAGKISLITISSDAIRVIHLIAAAIGLFLSVKNQLTAKITGYIMCMPYVLASLSFLAAYVDMRINENGHMDVFGWFTDFVVPLIFAACILLYFVLKERRVPAGMIMGICLVTVGYLILGYKNRFMRFTDLGFVVTTAHMLGKICMSALLGYQAYVWDKKKRVACS
ncbi:MAG: helix-turn-helix domain-containing protein [Lachnospiraceae bacterium]|nr:helix-turn-helix domain-containing protein [Lachnospiraceae bacterium]